LHSKNNFSQTMTRNPSMHVGSLDTTVTLGRA